MKIIPKLQQGGFARFYAGYVPSQGTSQAQSSKQQVSNPSSKGSKNDDISKSDILKMLKDVKGLPNDAAYLAHSLEEMYIGVNNGDIHDLSLAYVQNLLQIQKNTFYKEQYDKSREHVVSQEGLNEWAIYDNKLVVWDKKQNQMKLMSKQDIQDSTDSNFQILTNNDVLTLRAEHPNLVNDTTAFKIVNNGIGMSKVARLISSQLSALGTDSSEYGGQTVRLNGNLVAGAEILTSLANGEKGMFDGSTKLEGLHEWKLLSKTQQRQAKYALYWLYNSLPDNAKTLLSLKSDNVEGLIMSLIQSRVSSTRQLDVDLKQTWQDLTDSSSKSKSSSSGGGSDDENLGDVKWNAVSQWLKGYGISKEFIINPGSNYAYRVISNGMPLVDSDNKPLGSGKTLQEVTEGGYAGVLDTSQATMGGKRINPSLLNQVFLDEGRIYSIDLPVMSDGVTPDLRSDTLQRKNEAEANIKAYGIDLKNPADVRNNISRINQIYKSYGFQDNVYKPDGTINERQWRRFGVVNGKADGRALDNPELEDNNLLSTITDKNELNTLVDRIQENNKKYTFDNHRLIGKDDAFYRGTIYIPIDESYIAAQVGTGEKFTTETGLQMNIQDQYLQLGSQASRNLNITTNQPN